MIFAFSALAVLFVLWVAVNLKTSRSDGTLVAGVHPYRVMLGHITPRRNDAIVYFDSYVRAEKLLAYIAEARKRFAVDVTHCLVGAVGVALRENPRMNRFVVGRRLYQRRERTVTFSAKRKRLDRDAKLAAVKIVLGPGETEDFKTLCGRISAQIGEERSDRPTYLDKELGLLTSLPRAILVRGVRLFFWADYHNLLPRSFIDNDAMFTSVFVANLGSLDMEPGYHHLYEWGNCPVFLTAGRIGERPAVVNGQLTVEKSLHLRWSYDERIDDGLNARFGIEAVRRVLEDPFTQLGGLD
jgi:hypothetical protein